MELFQPVPDGAREVPPGGICPKCRSPRVHRSRVRGRLEAAARAVTPYRPFSCSDCKWRGWCWPEPSQGRIEPLPPLPDRRRRTPRTETGRRVLSPAQVQSLRARQHVVVALLLAGLTAGGVRYCQREPDLVVTGP